MLQSLNTITITFLLGCQLIFPPGSGKLKVLIVDGFSNHDWKQTTLLVKNILEKSGLFTVDVSTAPLVDENTVRESWKPPFQDYDVVIQNTNNIYNKKLRWPKAVEKALGKYVRSGGGLYILHSANNAFVDWKAYNKMIGLGWRSKDEGISIQISKTGKIIKIPKHEGKSTFHGPRTNQVIYKLHDHPINEDFPEAWMTPDMELYQFPRGPARNLTVLSYAIDEKTNVRWPVEWVVRYGKGRVYNSSMGHLWKGDTYPPGYRCIGFQTALIRATEWLATGKASYPIPKNFPSNDEIEMAPLDAISQTDRTK